MKKLPEALGQLTALQEIELQDMKGHVPYGSAPLSMLITLHQMLLRC